MGRTNCTFAKHLREIAKKQKQDFKRQRKTEQRQQKVAAEAAVPNPPSP